MVPGESTTGKESAGEKESGPLAGLTQRAEAASSHTTCSCQDSEGFPIPAQGLHHLWQRLLLRVSDSSGMGILFCFSYFCLYMECHGMVTDKWNKERKEHFSMNLGQIETRHFQQWFKACVPLTWPEPCPSSLKLADFLCNGLPKRLQHKILSKWQGILLKKAR